MEKQESKKIDNEVEVTKKINENKLDDNLVMTFNIINDKFKVNNKEKRNLTQLEMHKLLYITYLYFLNKTKKILFDAQFEAWQYGPVIRKLYRNPLKQNPKDINYMFKYFQKISNEIIEKFDKNKNIIWLKKDKDFTEIVTKGNIKNWIELTHKTDPWKETSVYGIIDKKMLDDYGKKTNILALK